MCLHTNHTRYNLEGVAETSTFYQKHLAMRNTADVTGLGKPIGSSTDMKIHPGHIGILPEYVPIVCE
jgi:hypothetical protein